MDMTSFSKCHGGKAWHLLGAEVNQRRLKPRRSDDNHTLFLTRVLIMLTPIRDPRRIAPQKIA